MTSFELGTQVRDALNVDLTPSQAARLDAALSRRLESHLLRRTQRPKRLVIVLAAALLILVPLVAAVSAGIRSTESPRGLESAAAYQAEIDAAKAVVPLPVGATWPPSVDAPDQNGSYPVGSGLSAVQDYAICPWLESWLAARAEPDSAQAVAAHDYILAIPTSEMYQGEFADQSYRNVLDGIIRGVGAGDANPAQGFVEANCSAAQSK
jgi:hypothetical protein